MYRFFCLLFFFFIFFFFLYVYFIIIRLNRTFEVKKSHLYFLDRKFVFNKKRRRFCKNVLLVFSKTNNESF